MAYNLIQDLFGIFGFLRRYSDGLQEIVEALAGFHTGTPGAYNPVNEPNRWKNTKEKPYIETPFTVQELTHLTVISVKDKTKKIKLTTVKSCLPIQTNDNLHVCKNVSVLKNINLSVFKEKLFKNKIQKLKYLSGFDVNNVNQLNIYNITNSDIHTPIDVKTWLRRNLSTKLGVCSWLKSKVTNNIHGRTYIVDDVGTISDIELLGIINEVEMIDAI